MTLLEAWITAAFTLAIYSFLYEDNPVYKVAEHIFVGSSAGYHFAQTWNNVVVPDVINALKTSVAAHHFGIALLALIPAVLGLMSLAMLNPNYAWLSHYPVCVMVGYGSGAAIVASIQTDILKQIVGTALPVIPGIMTASGKVLSTGEAVNNLVIVVSVVCATLYFFFSVEHTGPFMAPVSKIGIIVLMITFGAQFGATIMGRIQLLVGRSQFLVNDWFLPTLHALGVLK